MGSIPVSGTVSKASGCGVIGNTSVFQTDVEGSSPFVRTKIEVLWCNRQHNWFWSSQSGFESLRNYS